MGAPQGTNLATVGRKADRASIAMEGIRRRGSAHRLVRLAQQRWGYRDPQGLGRLQGDEQLNLRGLLDRQGTPSRAGPVFRSVAQPKHQQLAAQRRRQERAIGGNGEFVRAHIQASQHRAAGRVDVEHGECRVPRHPLQMRADVEFAGWAERHGEELTVVGPLPETLPLGVEPLQPAVLTVSNIDMSLRTNSNGMDHLEFTRAGAVFAPCTDLASSGIVLNDARVAVVVRDQHMPVLGEGHVGRAAKGSAGIRHLANTDRQQQLPFRREFVHHGRVGVHRPDVPVWIEPDAVGDLEHALPPRPQQGALHIQHDDGVAVRRPVEHIQGALLVHCHCGNPLERPRRMHCKLEAVHGELRDSLYEVAKRIGIRVLRQQRCAHEGQQDEDRSMHGEAFVLVRDSFFTSAMCAEPWIHMLFCPMPPISGLRVL
jgi:hypothetical protein